MVAEFKQAEKEFKKLQAHMDKLDDQIRMAGRVGLIHKGIPIQVFGRGSGDSFDALGDDNTRGGHYYKRVDTGWYGIVTYTDSFGHKDEKTEFVPGWKTKKAAKEALLEWIVTGVRPKCPNSVH
jgi:hypothetical protein